MNYHIPALILAVTINGVMAAAPQFDRVYGSHMVLPHGKNVPVRGTADPNKEVSVSFGAATVTTTADNKGRWTVTLPPMKPNATGQNLTATQGSDTTTLQDVLVGEVWVASGQSNMLRRMNQTDGKAEIPNSGDNLFRFLNNRPQANGDPGKYNQKQFDSLNKEKFFPGKWQVSSPQSTPTMSAVAYFFCKELRKHLNMPVGIIHSSLGGSEMAAWIPEEALKKHTKFKSLIGDQWQNSELLSAWVRQRSRENLANFKDKPPVHPFKPSFLYETGIEWTTGFPVTGVLWYQGESDAEPCAPDKLADWTETNKLLLSSLVNSWRDAYKNPTLPFVIIQLPRINHNSRRLWPQFRELQEQLSKTEKNVFCVNTIDLGATTAEVHPPEKKTVGERAAATALNKIYGKKVACEGPTFKAAKAAGNKLHIQLIHAKGLKTTDGKAPAMFEIAGADGKYYPATAEITNNKGATAVITLSSDKVQKPVHARYCWNCHVTPNLVNSDNLPARQFRTGKE